MNAMDGHWIFGLLPVALAPAAIVCAAALAADPGPIPGRVPDQTLLPSGTGGIDHAQATRASDGSYAWVYIPTGDAVTVDMTKLAGPRVSASRYSPRDGGKTAIGQYGISGTRTFDPPGATGSGDDWVLLLESTTER